MKGVEEVAPGQQVPVLPAPRRPGPALAPALPGAPGFPNSSLRGPLSRGAKLGGPESPSRSWGGQSRPARLLLERRSSAARWRDARRGCGDRRDSYGREAAALRVEGEDLKGAGCSGRGEGRCEAEAAAPLGRTLRRHAGVRPSPVGFPGGCGVCQWTDGGSSEPELLPLLQSRQLGQVPASAVPPHRRGLRL
ncbi:lymphocyte antigen 6L isoform X2 [Nycticebus coucang]|uniref:lymphocyte antigen 6L isoform X2 n=1 Tax=Nycticebus coucang TaxID=9470 RepID=UPI00234CF861|nr:lymphocyte antigen 6L isoform X2 [Nycticebus coucang]XP_053415545.1 lymphocyte antigen 6L isoform X2 [Nycticebus coucang]XP_053415546.1 lymphocyte antigen 6L isoform X2 [Nycticebus coucang]